jgi:hypothetical protein
MIDKRNLGEATFAGVFRLGARSDLLAIVAWLARSAIRHNPNAPPRTLRIVHLLLARC